MSYQWASTSSLRITVMSFLPISTRWEWEAHGGAIIRRKFRLFTGSATERKGLAESEGYALKEIAQLTGRSLVNVSSHYYRGLGRLRKFVLRPPGKKVAQVREIAQNGSSHGVWTLPHDPHQEFQELCALSTTGKLTAEEWKRPNGHLAHCDACRKLNPACPKLGDGTKLSSRGNAARPKSIRLPIRSIRPFY